MKNSPTSPSGSVKIVNKWGKWFYVLPEFLDICPGYKKLSAMILLQDVKITNYCHNLDGPAYHSGLLDVPIYYINGTYYPEKQWEHEVEKIKFSNKLEDLLED